MSTTKRYGTESNKTLGHMIFWPLWRKEKWSGTAMSHDHHDLPKQSCKARCKETESETGRRKDGKTTSENGQAWQWVIKWEKRWTEKVGERWLLDHLLCPYGHPEYEWYGIDRIDRFLNDSQMIWNFKRDIIVKEKMTHNFEMRNRLRHFDKRSYVNKKITLKKAIKMPGSLTEDQKHRAQLNTVEPHSLSDSGIRNDIAPLHSHLRLWNEGTNVTHHWKKKRKTTHQLGRVVNY